LPPSLNLITQNHVFIYLTKLLRDPTHSTLAN